MKAILLAAVILVSSIPMLAQAEPGSGVTPEMRQEANTLYQASDWTKAAAAYEKIVKLEEANAGARYRLGNSLLSANRHAEALPHLEKVFAAAPNPVYALTLARAYARSGNKPKAFDVIEKSFAAGGIASEALTGEKDFASWQSDAQFQDLVRRSDLAVNPCKASGEFRQFDFWIGEWDVKTPQGQPAGSSSVQLILGQCIIFENWSGGGGTNGKSFNIFDTKDQKWHQSWVDDKGTFAHYVGGLQNGEMVVTADTIIAGKKTQARMTYTKLANGDVRQHGENSTDEGKTWTTSFDLIYTRKAR